MEPITIEPWNADNVGEAIRGDSWDSRMLQLIAKSDPPHREALRVCFPSHVAAYERWMAGPA